MNHLLVEREEEKKGGVAKKVEEEGTETVKKAKDGTDGNPRGNRYASSLPSNPSQMTVFYSGSVHVFDNITPEKAQAIMLIAAATAAATAAAANTGSPVLTRSPSSQSFTAVAAAPAMSQRQSQPQPQPNFVTDVASSLRKLQAELPIARRNSLQHFLEKRRDRVVSKSPYISKKTNETPGSNLGSEPATPLACLNEMAS